MYPDDADHAAVVAVITVVAVRTGPNTHDLGGSRLGASRAIIRTQYREREPDPSPSDIRPVIPDPIVATTSGAATAERVIEATHDFLRTPSVIGNERPFMDHLERTFARLGCSIVRRAGVLEVAGAGADERPEVLSVHIDRHGLIGTGDGEYEYAAHVERASRYGEDVRASVRALEMIRERFLGEAVLAYRTDRGEPIAEGVIEHAWYCDRRQNLVFRIPELERLPERTPVSFSPSFDFDGVSITGQLDNAISAAIVLALFEAGFDGRAIFTAQEEIGRSWRFTLDHLDASSDRDRPPLSLLVLDTSPFPDDAELSAGPVVLRNRDANGTFDSVRVARLKALCKARDIPYVVKDELIDADNREREADGRPPRSLGSTELGRIVTGSEGRITGATVQVPTIDHHSNRETTSRLAVEHVLLLLRAHLGLGADR